MVSELAMFSTSNAARVRCAAMPEALTERAENRLMSFYLPEWLPSPVAAAERIRLEATLKRMAFSASSRASRSRSTLLPSFLVASPVTSTAAGEPPSRAGLEAGLEIQILSLVAGGVGIGDIGRHQLLPHADQIHVLFEAVGEAIDHGRHGSSNTFHTAGSIDPGIQQQSG